jgi:hypothetical protein
MKFTVVIVFLLVPVLLTAEVQRRGGGGGGAGRVGGAGSVNRDVSWTSVRSPQDVNRNVTRNGDFNTNTALGTTVVVLPPDCSSVVVDEIGYSQCGSTWYEPYYSSTSVQYAVVGPPQ